MLQLKADVVFSNWQQRKNNWQQWFRLGSSGLPVLVEERAGSSARTAQ